MTARNVIVFPTDFSARSLEGLSWLRRMADTLQAEVHIIYVVEEPQVYSTLDMGPVPIPSVTELTDTANERLAGFIREHLPNSGAKPVSAVLVGRPSDEIVRYARESTATLVIMTTHGYGGLKHMLLGSTTEAVLREAPCPVLSIRAS